MNSKPQLVPHRKGSDFFGTTKSYFIRSDLDCFAELSSNHLHKASPKIMSLHSSCVNGDHYMAYEHAPQVGAYRECFFIIKGNRYRQVSNLSSDADAEEGNLHEDLRGGDFYLASSKYHHHAVTPIFIVIFQREGRFRAVSDLATGKPAKCLEFKDKKKDYVLHSNCQNGLYYWATKAFYGGEVTYYIIKGVDEWGVKVHYTKNLSTDAEGCDEIVSPSVVNFLPGGLAVTKGPTVGYWTLISSYTNSGNTDLEFTRKIEVRSGYRKCVVTEVQHNWKFSGSLSANFSSLIFGILCRLQFSLSSEHGGSAIDTEEENWTEETTTTEEIRKAIPSGESLYIWQFCLGHGARGGSENSALCRCQVFEISGSSSKPTRIPKLT
ncbi:uncharacterized protein [Oscarella lobularis]|uniref:uncharacterized protein n=1 Tax=Oscarella lobularis TaxID=121494 RepID=UPI003313E833